MRFLVISCSLNPESRSCVLAQTAHKQLCEQKLRAEFIDLRTANLPKSGDPGLYFNRDLAVVTGRIAEARGIIIATPTYNFEAEATMKNLFSLTGEAWRDKVVAFVCAASHLATYMSVMPHARTLMLHFRCMIIPRFVFSPPAARREMAFGDAANCESLEGLTAEVVRVTDALFPE